MRAILQRRLLLSLSPILLFCSYAMFGSVASKPAAQSRGPAHGQYIANSKVDKTKTLHGFRINFSLTKSKVANLDTVSGTIAFHDANWGTGQVRGNYDRKKNRLRANIEQITNEGVKGSEFPFDAVVDGKYDFELRVFEVSMTVRKEDGAKTTHFAEGKAVRTIVKNDQDEMLRTFAKCTPSTVAMDAPATITCNYVLPSMPNRAVTVEIAVSGAETASFSAKGKLDETGRGSKKIRVGFSRTGRHVFEVTVRVEEGPSATTDTACEVTKESDAGPMTEFSCVKKETREPMRDDGGQYAYTVWTPSENQLTVETVPRNGSYPAAKVNIDFAPPDKVLVQGKEYSLKINSSMTKSEQEPPRLNVSAGYEISGAITDLKGAGAFCGFASTGVYYPSGEGYASFKVADSGDTIIFVQTVYGVGFSPVTVYTYKRGAKSKEGPIITRMSLKEIE